MGLLRGDSCGHRLPSPGNLPDDFGDNRGWRSPSLALRQHEAFQAILANPGQTAGRADFQALRRLLRELEQKNLKEVLEVGCGSGWNQQILTEILHNNFRYTGVDLSLPSLRLGRQERWLSPAVQADACRLPFPRGRFDLVISGTVLMHLENYERAIEESIRVASRFVLFHTVLVRCHGPTARLVKKAYGSEVMEIVLQEDELKTLLKRAGVDILRETPSVPYDLGFLLGEPTFTQSYLCRK